MDTDSEEGDLRIEENGKVDSSVELFGVQLEVGRNDTGHT